MADSIETALRLSDGTLLLHLPDAPASASATGSSASGTPAPSTAAPSRSRHRATSASTRRMAPARTAPGSGSRLEIDPDLVLPDRRCRCGEGAILPWRRMATTESWFAKILEAVAEHYGFRTDLPVRELSDDARQILLFGNRGERVEVRYQARNGNIHTFRTSVRGRRSQPPAALPRDRLGDDQGRDRALHDDPPVPDLQRDAPEAGVAGRDGRRSEHHRDDADSR